MAGKGLRTKALGEFKPFIKIAGRKILCWLISSIRHHISPSDIFVFTTTDYFAKKYKVEIPIMY